MDYSKLSDAEIKRCVHSIQGFTEDDYIDDYCNNPADAWPIIVGNAIGLMPFKKGEAEAWSLSAGLLSNTTVRDKNPLRAAMIVYLMMQESE